MVEDELDTRSTSVSDADDGAISSPTSIFGNAGHLSPSNSPPAMPEPTSSPRISAAPPSPRTRFQSLDSGVPSGSFTPPTVAVPIAARKSRPTASDFIDQTPPRPSSAFSEPSRAALLKRKRCFVDPQVWPKRLIIDLDSSDEEDGEEVEGGVEPGAGVASTSSSRASVERNMSGRPNVDRGRDMASQMLLEKELQIKAMMQKIKMRELKKKLGIASASGTPLLTTANIVPTSEGATALPPASTVISPSGSSNAEATEMESTNQETVAGVTSILEIQQETALSYVEVSGDNTLGFELETNVSKLDKGKGKAVELNATAEDFKGSITDVPAAAILEDVIRLGHDLQATEQNTSRVRIFPIMFL
ncbi:hypothetical protein FRC12_016831 [Ceratobasidium sp. 428]|nr:hypothetical protein FRC12_016831 [Ceratobasidium sp. 428]